MSQLKMDVIKGEEAKRVASGGGHFRVTSDELGLPGAQSRLGGIGHIFRYIPRLSSLPV